MLRQRFFVILQEIGGKIKKSNGQGVTGMGRKSSEQSKKSHNQFQPREFFLQQKKKASYSKFKMSFNQNAFQNVTEMSDYLTCETFQ